MNVAKGFLFLVVHSFVAVAAAQYQPSVLYQQAETIHASTGTNAEKLLQVQALTNSFERNHFPKDSIYALLLHRIGLYKSKEKQYVEAIIYTQRAIKINVSNAPGTSRSYAAKSYYNIGDYYKHLENYTQALRYFDSAIQIAVAYPERQEACNSSHFDSYKVHTIQGNYQEALNCVLRGMGLVRNNDPAAFGAFYYNIASAATSIKNFALAKKYLPMARAYYASVKDTVFLISCNDMSANIAVGEGHIQQAEMLLQQYVQYFQKNGSIEFKASAFISAGLFYMYEIKDYGKAEYYFQQTIQLYKESGSSSLNYASAVNNLGQIFFNQRQYQQALQWFHTAFMLQCGRYAITDTFQNPPLWQLTSLPGKQFTFTILRNKAELLMHIYRRNRQPKYQEASARSFLLADSLFTDMRNNQTGEQSKLYWRELSRNFFQQALELCSISQNTEAAFYYMEKSRAVLLNDHLIELGASINLPPAEAAKEQDLKMIVVEKQLQLSAIHITDEKYGPALNTFLKAQHNLEIFLQETEDNYPAFSQYKYADKVPSVNKLQKYLQRTGRQWVQYFVSDTLLFVLYANGSDMKLHRQPVGALEQTLANFYNSCTNKAGQNNQYNTFIKVAANIYDTLLRPLQLKPGSLIVSPDNIIIPFDALCTDAKQERMAIHDFAVSYAYSARFLLNPVTYTTKATGVFFGMAPVTFPVATQLPALRSSGAALQALKEIYPDAKMVYEKEATRNQLFKNLADYTIVNLYTHAQGGSDTSEPQLFFSDSAISLSELQAIQKPATQLIVLSACQTNTGKMASGEGVYTLARGFAMAGIPASVATLWNADEQATYFITGEFHKNIIMGMDKDLALQQAKLAWLQQCNREQALPFYWANLTLMGNADKIVKPNYFWWYIAGGLVLVIATAGWFRYKKRKM